MVALQGILPDASTCAYSSPSDDAWLSPNQISARYHVCGQTVRRLIDRNAIPAVRLESGYRRVRAADAELYFQSLVVQREKTPVNESGASNESGEVLFYGRVSSIGQKADLERQVERLRKYAKDKLSCSNPTEYKDVASGISETRDGYNRMVDNILKGKHNGATLLVENVDRLSRMNRSLFMKICEHHQITVIITAGDEVQKDSVEDWTRDLILLCQVYGNRMSGRRSAERNRVALSPEQINEVFSLHKAGYSIRDIEKRYKGTKSENGKNITQTVIRRLLKKNGPALAALVDTSKARNSFHRFEVEAIRSTSKPSLVSKKRIVEVYLEWCKNKGEQPISDKNIGSYYKRKGIESRYSRSGSLLYVGLSLITNKGS